MLQYRILFVLACILLYANSVYGAACGCKGDGDYGSEVGDEATNEVMNSGGDERHGHSGCGCKRAEHYGSEVGDEATNEVMNSGADDGHGDADHDDTSVVEHHDDSNSDCGCENPKPCGCKPEPAVCRKPVQCECKPECGPNEHFIKTKQGQMTCYGRDPDLCEPVTECRCLPGFVRHKGVCIRPCDCPPKCAKNEVFELVSKEDDTCFGCGDKLCNPVWRCRCQNGFVRYRGKCIRKCECPKYCKDPNAELIVTREGRKTCYGQEPRLCTPVRECRCKCGYVYHNGECIKPCDCPKCCGPNEVFKKTNKGEMTCSGRMPDPCHPIIACRCKKGYVRHEGVCIKKCECPRCCNDPNARLVWTREGRKTCFGQEPDLCKTMRVCRCKDGYVWHKGSCIKRCDCPKPCPKPCARPCPKPCPYDD